MVTELIKNKSQHLNKYFNNIQTIYVTCLKEIIRQVTIECEERGILLERVIKGYRDLFSCVIYDLNGNLQVHKQDYENRLKNIHQKYNFHIKNLNEKIKKINEEKKSVEKELVMRTTEALYMKKQVKSLNHSVQTKINFINFLVGQLDKAGNDMALMREIFNSDVPQIFGIRKKQNVNSHFVKLRRKTLEDYEN